MARVTKALVCYPVCGMVQIKEPLLLIGKSNPCSVGCKFSLSPLESKPYNNKNVLSVLLNETFLPFPPYSSLFIKTHSHWVPCTSQCSTKRGNKGCGMCYPVCGMMHIK